MKLDMIYRKLYLSIFIIILALYGCKDNPELAYPVSTEDIEGIIEDVELAWSVDTEKTYSDQLVIFELKNEEQQLIAIINCVTKEDERGISITFLPKMENQQITSHIETEDIPKAFSLISRLAGIRDDAVLYEIYSTEEPELVPVSKKPGMTPRYEQVAVWTGTTDNKYFHISAGILENPTSYELSSIACYTDADMAPSLTK